MGSAQMPSYPGDLFFISDITSANSVAETGLRKKLSRQSKWRNEDGSTSLGGMLELTVGPTLIKNVLKASLILLGSDTESPVIMNSSFSDCFVLPFITSLITLQVFLESLFYLSSSSW
jgi:hypothetical protein